MTFTRPISSITLGRIYCWSCLGDFSKLTESRVGQKFSPDYIRLILSHRCPQWYFIRRERGSCWGSQQQWENKTLTLLSPWVQQVSNPSCLQGPLRLVLSPAFVFSLSAMLRQKHVSPPFVSPIQSLQNTAIRAGLADRMKWDFSSSNLAWW